jgi:ribosomal protein S8
VEKDELFSDTFLKKIFLDTSLVGTNDEELAVYLKKQGFIRRFKIIKNIQKTDFEIKTKGVEILRLSESMY